MFNTTIPGEYTFIFINKGKDMVLTMALHTYDEKEDPIEYDFVGERRVTRG